MEDIEKREYFQFPQFKNWESIEEVLKSNTPGNVDEFIEMLFKIYQHTLTDTKLTIRSIQEYLGSSLRYFFKKHPEITQKFFQKILPGIIKLALQFPVLIKNNTLPLLSAEIEQSVTLSRVIVSCILALGFLCTFGVESERKNYPPFEFSRLYSSLHHPQEAAKMLCLLNYFERVSEAPPKGNITVHRQVIKTLPDFSKSTKLLKKFKIESTGSIESSKDALQVDFANRYLGGGVLVGGCVQEEIRFSVNTELIVCCLFCEVMRDQESIIMIGSEQYSETTGYAFGLTFAGNFVETPLMADNEHINTTICAIDATDYRMGDRNQQYTTKYLKREIGKAYAGFFTSKDNEKAIPVATGNWGCGAFLGNKQHKCLVQYIAASEAERDLIYYTFNEKDLEQQMQEIINLLSGKTVRYLWELLDQYYKSGSWEKMETFDFIKGHVLKSVENAETAQE